MAWPLPTDLVNATTGLLEGTALWAYNVTFGLFWSALLLAFCVVIYIAASVYEDDRAFGFSGVVALFGSTILVTLNLMPWWIAGAFILAGAIGLVAMIMKSR